MTVGPAFVRDGRLDLLAADPLGRAPHSEVYEGLEMAAEPGSASEEGLRLLASWAASEEAETAGENEGPAPCSARRTAG